MGRGGLLPRPDGGEKFDDGWLRTGDIAAVDEQAFVQITDRSKDVIKSGGEWISSVELENELMAHPDVVEAAVIAKPDERWAERPLCCVVLRRGRDVSAGSWWSICAAVCRDWWLPDEFAFVDGDPQDERGQVRQEGVAWPAGRGQPVRSCQGVMTARFEPHLGVKNPLAACFATGEPDRPLHLLGRHEPADGETRGGALQNEMPGPALEGGPR